MAERKNRSIVEAARAMLEEKSLAKFYWAEAVRTAVYIQNRIGEKLSTHELYFERKPNSRHLRVFVSIAYVHVSKEKRRKLDGRPRSVSWSATVVRLITDSITDSQQSMNVSKLNALSKNCGYMNG